MRHNLRISIGSLLFMISFLIAMQMHGQAITDLSGNWTRNDERCDPGPGISLNSIPVSIEVKEENGSMITKTTSRNGKGEIAIGNDTLKLNGSEGQRISGDGSKQIFNLQWTSDHKNLTTNFTTKDGAGNVIRTKKKLWSITDDGKLQIILDMSVDGRDFHFIEVFDKK